MGGRIEDKYFIQKVKLGQGSFGTVWRAVDLRTNNVVAVKQLDKAAMPRRGVRREDIEREITVMKAVQHDNITRLLDTVEDQRSIYLALEYCSGGDFGDKVKERGNQLTEPEAADWVLQIVSAIHALHSKGICHRDIKPDNFMVHGEADTLKLSDFGLALFLPRGKLLVDKCGTPAFMSPEQHKLPRHSRGYGYPCDMWAAGVSMYMLMLGGRHPFLNSSNQIDEKRLLGGTLNFSTGQGFFGFGAEDTRFSPLAKQLCRRMVEPQPDKRLSSEAALREPWLTEGDQRRAAAAAASPAAAGSPAVSPAPTPDPNAASSAAASAMREAIRGSAVNTLGLGYLFGATEDEDSQTRSRSQGDDQRLGRGQGRGQGQDSAGQAATGSRGRSRTEPSSDGGKLSFQVSLPSSWKPPSPSPEMAPSVSEPTPNEDVGGENEELRREIHALRQKVEQQQEALLKQQALERRQQEVGQALPSVPEARRNSKGSVSGVPHWPSGSNGGEGVLRYSSEGRLPVGAKCRFHGSSWSGWMPAVVEGLNEEDGTYNLDVRSRADLNQISPRADVPASEAWMPGTLVLYESTSLRYWLPAIICSFNESNSDSEGSYNLDVRECASVDRIRPRLLVAVSSVQV